jgi:chemotaxis protein methyltransferase CheR
MTLLGGEIRGARDGFLVEGEFAFTHRDFRRIAALLHGAAGIHLPDGKAALVYSRLAKRLRALGLQSFKHYCTLIESDEGADERQRLLAALTTNVTRFFREPHHFEHLGAGIVPGLIERARQGGRVRLWSAGCSSGEEAYSMALTLLGAAPDAYRYDIKILATDINVDVLAAGRQGVYPQSAVAPIPRDTLRRWFEPAWTEEGEPAWRTGEALAALVAFRELNLVGPWPMTGRFDVVFCRNTVIYFDEAVQGAFWRRLPDVMTPGAHLYIGHSERLHDPEGRFVSAGMTTYRLKEEGR